MEASSDIDQTDRAKDDSWSLKNLQKSMADWRSRSACELFFFPMSSVRPKGEKVGEIAAKAVVHSFSPHEKASLSTGRAKSCGNFFVRRAVASLNYVELIAVGNHWGGLYLLRAGGAPDWPSPNSRVTRAI
jgi:hypothetical protein